MIPRLLSFSSPFPGTFFQLRARVFLLRPHTVFVPFPGDFFSITLDRLDIMGLYNCFRPLSRGLFFNCRYSRTYRKRGQRGFSSPFPGTFFQYVVFNIGCTTKVFVPFPGDFFSMRSFSSTPSTPSGVFVPFPGDFFSIS